MGQYLGLLRPYLWRWKASLHPVRELVMKKLLLLVPLLSLLGGCAGLGRFTGEAIGGYQDSVRPVYYEPPPYYYRPRWHRRGWW